MQNGESSGHQDAPWRSSLALIDALRDLPPRELADLEQRLTSLSVRRGEVLMRQGDKADALYLVVSGRFAVQVDGRRVAEVGSALNVATVLEGSVRAAGNRMRISVQLVKVANGFDHVSVICQPARRASVQLRDQRRGPPAQLEPKQLSGTLPLILLLVRINGYVVYRPPPAEPGLQICR